MSAVQPDNTTTRRCRPTRGIVALLAALLIVSSIGCAPDEDAERASWLQSTLVEDNYRMMLRNPTGVAGKFAKMAQSPYRYFRGTAGQYVRDATEPGGFGYLPTKYGSPESSDVLLVGDPHPENLGTYRPGDGEITVDFNDFDAARYGPYHLDVRRLALGFWVAAEMMVDSGLLTELERDQAVRAVAAGYVAEVRAQETGEPPGRVRRTNQPGRILEDLMRRAERDGRAREELEEFTSTTDDRRELVLGFNVPEPAIPGVMASDGLSTTPPEASPLIQDGITAPTAEEEALVATLMKRYPDTLGDSHPTDAFRILDLGRRVGPGVSSYPLLRFYVVVEGPTSARDDDWLLEVKEVTDPPGIRALMDAGLLSEAPRFFRDNGERTVRAQRQLQSTGNNDPLLGWASIGAHSFRIRDRTKFQKGLDVARIMEKRYQDQWSADDIVELSYLSGRVLARSHLGAQTASGRSGLTVIAEALDDGPGFVDETAAFAAHYGPRLMSDYQLFLELLDQHGPLLGARL